MIELHPEARAFLDAMRAASHGRPKVWDVPVAQARANAQDMARQWNSGAAPSVATEDIDFDLPGRTIRVRRYTPHEADPERGIFVYAHGGGWIVGDLDIEDLKLRKLCAWSGAQVFSVDYRLAPEHPHPLPINDLSEAARRIIEHNPGKRVAVGGASAGAHLAIAAAQALGRKGQDLHALVLFYGVYDLQFRGDSYSTCATGFGLETEAMKYFRRCYIGAETDFSRAGLSPLLGELSGLPPTFINAVRHDPLFDDSLALARTLETVGTEVELDLWNNTIHGFTAMSAIMPHADEAIRNAATWLAGRLVAEGGKS